MRIRFFELSSKASRRERAKFAAILTSSSSGERVMFSLGPKALVVFSDLDSTSDPEASSQSGSRICLELSQGWSQMFTVQVLKLPFAGSGLHLDRSKFSLRRHSVSTSSMVKAYEMPLTTCKNINL